MPKTTGQIFHSQIIAYLASLDDLRAYMCHRGLWTHKAMLLKEELSKKSLELSQLIPLD